jgi:hypothetical protein
MPVIRSNFHGGVTRNLAFLEIARSHVQQCGNPAKEMQSVRGGENVEKAGGLIARDVYACGNQLKPGEQLAGQKQDSSVQLLSNKIAVLSHRTFGRRRGTQVSLTRFSTRNATHSPRKNTRMEIMPRAIAVE